ncbi:lysophospholipid acyltransferase family protein [Azonexus sp.]|jgi:1-acyl-sn-glycerol-3-phosphate acyltransferase|uniref:lysophospholipid acyltransferase family protein n=1 Tax=Azonexus sp. TaxID=1872668 RepID=UPI00282C6FDD|nr:lysophospholipid acyltransferase family protein [Azonexus sp.]MDR1995391.1 1-acyl-sn-glycerol-3-phosphate acyltransferase [Azonexus sp.]
MTKQSHRQSRALWSIYEYFAMVMGLGFLALLCLLWLPFALLLHVLLPRRIGQPVGRFLIMAGFRIYLRFLTIVCDIHFDLAELDSLRHDKPLLLTANHPSLLDAVMIVSRFPNMVCVMKAALMNNILFGSAARLARYIPNHAPLDVVLRARTALRDGAHLLIFPEGTRTVHFPMDACTASAGLIAQRARVPVQTLFIEYSSPYLGKAWSLGRPPELPLYFRIRVGRRFAPPANVAAFAGELEACFRAGLAADPEDSATLPIAQEVAP